MSRKRFFAYFFGIVGAVVLAVALYLAFGDLGRHKAASKRWSRRVSGARSPSMVHSG